jgi:alkylglycerol monooxygenase
VDLITLFIPIFLVSIAIEVWMGRRRGLRVLRGPDMITDLSLGAMQTLVGVVLGGLLFLGYFVVYEHHRRFTIPNDSVLAWIGIIVGVDFFYYWFHRFAHRVNFAWASHAPHHSSEDYNLAVALRQGPLQPLVSRFFYLPLAWIGFPVEMMALSLSINTIYQFFIHTELVNKLGPLELVLNTPSHHRVHHGCNGRYLDRNHGGILIIWDRLFGTFEPEGERPIYGTVKQLGSWNPWVATWQPFADIASLMLRAPRFVDKVRVWFMPPEWKPQGVDLAWPDVVARSQFNVRASPARARYVTVMFVVTLAALVFLLFFGASHLDRTMLILSSAWIVLSFTSLGAFLDEKSWAPKLEVARWIAFVPLVLSIAAAASSRPT